MGKSRVSDNAKYISECLSIFLWEVPKVPSWRVMSFKLYDCCSKYLFKVLQNKRIYPLTLARMQKQSPEVFCKKRCSYNFRKTHRKTPVPKSPCNFIKKETLAQVFSCKFCKISKNTFLQNTRGRLSEDGVFGLLVDGRPF